jgi:hypothetical protein
MNGAIADPAASAKTTPNVRRISKTGSSQNFFLFFRKPHKSFKNVMRLAPF